jgi:hypothetical protein
MASLIFNSFPDDLARALIDMDADTFKMMLVTSSYVPNKDTHTKRSDVTNEVTGTGYTTGGATCACTVVKDTVNDKVTFTFAVTDWPTSTLTARGAVIYKSTGTASNDNLVAYDDFGSNVVSSSATFSVAQNVITLQNS